MDYQSNSHKSKKDLEIAAEKNIEKVVTGEVIERKKSLGYRFKNIFFSGTLKDATKYVTADVIFPALRDLVYDIGNTTMKRMLWGDTSPGGRRRHLEVRSRVQYNNPLIRTIDPRSRDAYLPDQPPHPYRLQRMDLNDIILQTKEEAELVIERLIDIVDKYQVASVADLYELIDLPSSHIHQKWGWSYIHNAEVRQIREGYLLVLPEPEAI